MLSRERELTEDELVAALSALNEAQRPGPKARRVVVGIGDDAAVWQPSRSRRSLITTDALVDGVHFFADRMSADEIGYRTMAANLSDIAAMGGRPVLAVVAIGLPTGTSEAWVLEAYRAMAGLASAYGARIVGGDLSRSPAIALVITVVGEASARRLKLRSGARVGDVAAATGPFGASRAGLEALRTPLELPEDVRARARAAFSRPQPRLAEGRWLAASSNVHAMMDCSDGLAIDLGRMANASKCGAVVERIPVAPVARAVAEAASAKAADWALSGGEDFELLVAVAPGAFVHLAGAFERRFGRPLERIGTFTAGKGLALRTEAGALVELERSGWDHLAGDRPVPTAAATPS